MDDAIDPKLIETSVDIRRPIDGGVDVLRQFDASVEYSTKRDTTRSASSVAGSAGRSRTKTFMAQSTPSAQMPNLSAPRQLQSSRPIPTRSSTTYC